MPHVLNWFEIPVTDFARAQRFYEAVLGFKIEPFVMGAMTMGMLGTDHESVGGAIVQGEGGVPAQNGTLVYLNGGDDLAPMLARAVAAGATVAVPKTEIGNNFGYFAHFIDTEGNKVGLHSMS